MKSIVGYVVTRNFIIGSVAIRNLISGKALLFLTPLPLNRGAAESLGISESSRVPQKALRVQLISELDWYYLVLANRS